MSRLRFVAMMLFAVGCSSGVPSPVPVVTEYFPLRKGLFQIYSVDSIVVEQNIETAYAYELKTEVTDSFPNAGGGFTYVVERYKRITSSSPWTVIPSWSARVDAYQATVNEGNISYVRVASPIGNGKSWDGNSLNLLGGTEKCLDSDKHTCDLYVIESFAKPFTSSAGLVFDNTVTVVENDNGDLVVAQDKRREVYAVNTGLVYREVTQLEYCTTPACLGKQFVTKGLKYKQSISEHGG